MSGNDLLVGNGKGMDNSNPEVREWEGNEKKTFPKFENRKGVEKNIPEIREREGNEKSIPILIRERESEAFILGNGQEQEFPLTPEKRTHWENS